MLPREFTRVEYIRSDGKTWIDTGIIPNYKTRVSAQLKVLSVNGNSNSWLLGARTNASTNRYELIWLASAQTYAYFYDSQRHYFEGVSGVGEITFDIGQTGGQMNGVEVEASASTFSGSTTIYLFSCNSGSPASESSIAEWGKIDIYDGSDQKRRYFGVVRTDGAVGLYDEISGTLFLGNGSGKLIAGSAIVPGIPTDISYQKSNYKNISISWNAVDNANHYVIERDGVKIADVAEGDCIYVDPLIEGGASHTYSVTAWNGTQQGGTATISVSRGVDDSMLPRQYTAVKKIFASGTQYIDLGIKLSHNSRVVVRYDGINEAQWCEVFGAGESVKAPSKNFLVVQNLSTGVMGQYGDEYYTGPIASDGALIDFNKNNFFINGLLVHSFAMSEFVSPFTMRLFDGATTDEDWSRYSGGIDAVQVYDNSHPVRDLVACLNEYGEAGYFDLVTSEFYSNDGSGTLSAGEIIVPGFIGESSLTITDRGVLVRWEAAAHANGYTIERDGGEIASLYGDIGMYIDTSANAGETHLYTITPYNGEQPGQPKSHVVQLPPSAPAQISYTIKRDVIYLKWSVSNGAQKYTVFVDGEKATDTTETMYADVGLKAPTVRTYTITASNEAGESKQSAELRVAFWGDNLPPMITDRTAADVDEAKRLIEKLRKGETLTDAESAAYLAGMRGAYNASDMNRVGNAVRYIADRLTAERYGVYVNPKIGWTMSDLVRQEDWNAYLDDVRHLRGILTLLPTTPKITDAMYDGIDHIEANHIEQILVDLDISITCIIRNYIYSGEVFAGEV